MTDPASERENTLRIAQAVAQFAANHPTIQVVPVYLTDVYAMRIALRKALTPFVDGLSTKPWEDRRLPNKSSRPHPPRPH